MRDPLSRYQESHAMSEPISNEFVCSGDRSRACQIFIEEHKARRHRFMNEKAGQLECFSADVSFAVLSLRRHKNIAIEQMKFLDLKSR